MDRKKNRVFRLSDAEFADLGQVAKHLADTTGQKYTRTDAVRHLAGTLSRSPTPFTLPHYGPIPCGRPRDITAPTPERLDIRAMFAGPDLFTLTASGTSMTDRGIRDGDYLVMRRADVADHGQVVAAAVNGAATLKVFHTRKRGKVVEYWLYPASDEHQPIFLDPAGENKVIGVLVGVIRKV